MSYKDFRSYLHTASVFLQFFSKVVVFIDDTLPKVEISEASRNVR